MEINCNKCGCKIEVADGQNIARCPECQSLQPVDLAKSINKAVDVSVNVGKSIIENTYGVDIDQIVQSIKSNTGTENDEIIYSDLCKKMRVATTNNEFIELADAFFRLNNYKDSLNMCKMCIDKLSFNSPDELAFIGNYYKKINAANTSEIATKCIDVATQWKQYETDNAEFVAKYESKPFLLTLWKKYSAIIIIAGIVTLLWGFIIFGGALILEYILRGISNHIKKKDSAYIDTQNDLHRRKQIIDALIYDLRKR